MRYRNSVVPVPVIVLVLALSCAIASPAQKPKSESQEKAAVLTGCVDEQEGHYVMVDDRNLSPIANLEADGFPTESFAKHLGHKVTVRGTVNSAGARPTFKVRSIETVSESCEPRK